MECIEAQRIVSERLDREEFDTAVLEEAKDHCRDCAECSAFVRALVALQRQPLPEPAEDLTARVMSAVELEVAKKAAVIARAASEPAAEPAADTSQAISHLKDRLLDPRNRRALLAWGSAAAVLLIVTGMGAVAGVRQILLPPPSGGDLQITSQEYGLADQSALTSAPAAGTGMAAQSKMATAAAPPYVVAGTTVYRSSGTASGIATDSLLPVSDVVTALDTGGNPVPRDTFTLQDPARIYVTDDAGALLAFDRVTRTYNGTTYALQSGPIPSFGTWPSLPSGISAPTDPSGSPTFTQDGTDDAGTTVYRLSAGTAGTGIGVAPNSSAGDPAAGNPGWTWWVPLR